jgi:hypothetical protein
MAAHTIITIMFTTVMGVEAKIAYRSSTEAAKVGERVVEEVVQETETEEALAAAKEAARVKATNSVKA